MIEFKRAERERWLTPPFKRLCPETLCPLFFLKIPISSDKIPRSKICKIIYFWFITHIKVKTHHFDLCWATLMCNDLESQVPLTVCDLEPLWVWLNTNTYYSLESYAVTWDSPSTLPLAFSVSVLVIFV